jgi:hypothetical protein
VASNDNSRGSVHSFHGGTFIEANSLALTGWAAEKIRAYRVESPMNCSHK